MLSDDNDVITVRASGKVVSFLARNAAREKESGGNYNADRVRLFGNISDHTRKVAVSIKRASFSREEYRHVLSLNDRSCFLRCLTRTQEGKHKSYTREKKNEGERDNKCRGRNNEHSTRMDKRKKENEYSYGSRNKGEASYCINYTCIDPKNRRVFDRVPNI